jgi:hypothetical protein
MVGRSCAEIGNRRDGIRSRQRDRASLAALDNARRRYKHIHTLIMCIDGHSIGALLVETHTNASDISSHACQQPVVEPAASPQPLARVIEG